MITGLKLGVRFNSLHFLMMPAFKRKIIHTNWVAFQAWRPHVSPNSPKTSDMKYSRLAVYVVSFDDTNFVTYQSLLNWGCNLFRDKENHQVWLLARWPWAADGACLDTVFIPSRDLPAFRYTKQPAGFDYAITCSATTAGFPA